MLKYENMLMKMCIPLLSLLSKLTPAIKSCKLKTMQKIFLKEASINCLPLIIVSQSETISRALKPFLEILNGAFLTSLRRDHSIK